MVTNDKPLNKLQQSFIFEMQEKINFLSSDVMNLSKVFKSIIEYQERQGMFIDEIDLLFLHAANFDVSMAEDYEMTFRRLSEINDPIKSYDI